MPGGPNRRSPHETAPGGSRARVAASARTAMSFGRKRRIPALVALGLLVASAGTRGAWASHEDIGLGPAGSAMGEALTASSDGLAPVAHNPATLGQIRNPEFATGYSRSFLLPAGPADLSQIHGALGFPWNFPELPGALGFSWAHAARAGASLDRTLSAAYATRGWKEFDRGVLDAGLALKALSRSGKESGGGLVKAGVDAGLLLRAAGGGGSWGLSVLNINGPRTDLGTMTTDRAPATLKLGYCLSHRGFTMALDAAKREPSFGFPPSQSLGAGTQYGWHTARWGSWIGRTGLNLGDRSRSWGLGAAWGMLGARLEYSLKIPLGVGSRLGHAIGLEFRFGTWNPEREYEKMLDSELRYRQELTRALDSAEAKQKNLSEELGRLKADMEVLRAGLAAKTASEAAAQGRLKALEERRRLAQEALDGLQRSRNELSRKSKDSLFLRDWADFQKAKLDGTPDAALLERLQRLLRDYKDAGVDLSEANQELLRLLRGR